MKESEVRDLIQVIKAHGLMEFHDGKTRMVLDVQGLSLAWSYWDDNDSTHFDDDAYTDKITEVYVEGNEVFVIINNSEVYKMPDLPYDDRKECCDYIFEEIMNNY